MKIETAKEFINRNTTKRISELLNKQKQTMIEKLIASILTVIFIILLTLLVNSNVRNSYEFNNQYLNEWVLADRSSTIEAKKLHLDKFIKSLKNGENFAPNAYLFLPTPSTSFAANLEALGSLQVRLNSIEGMNPNSFEYNTAIQQITAQEQGEAGEMIQVFGQCYAIKNHILAYHLFSMILGVSLFFSAIALLTFWLILFS